MSDDEEQSLIEIARTTELPFVEQPLKEHTPENKKKRGRPSNKDANSLKSSDDNGEKRKKRKTTSVPPLPVERGTNSGAMNGNKTDQNNQSPLTVANGNRNKRPSVPRKTFSKYHMKLHCSYDMTTLMHHFTTRYVVKCQDFINGFSFKQDKNGQVILSFKSKLTVDELHRILKEINNPYITDMIATLELYVPKKTTPRTHGNTK